MDYRSPLSKYVFISTITRPDIPPPTYPIRALLFVYVSRSRFVASGTGEFSDPDGPSCGTPAAHILCVRKCVWSFLALLPLSTRLEFPFISFLRPFSSISLFFLASALFFRRGVQFTIIYTQFAVTLIVNGLISAFEDRSRSGLHIQRIISGDGLLDIAEGLVHDHALYSRSNGTLTLCAQIFNEANRK